MASVGCAGGNTPNLEREVPPEDRNRDDRAFLCAFRNCSSRKIWGECALFSIYCFFVSEAERQHRNTFLEEEKVIHDSVSITAILILIFYFFIINKNSFISFCHLKPFKGRFRFFHFERTKVYI